MKYVVHFYTKVHRKVTPIKIQIDGHWIRRVHAGKMTNIDERTLYIEHLRKKETRQTLLSKLELSEVDVESVYFPMNKQGQQATYAFVTFKKQQRAEQVLEGLGKYVPLDKVLETRHNSVQIRGYFMYAYCFCIYFYRFYLS